jgi:hypothetical protein
MLSSRPQKRAFITSVLFHTIMAEPTEREDVQVTGQSRPVRNVISYLRTLDGSAHPALDSINSDVIFDVEKSVYIVEPPM